MGVIIGVVLALIIVAGVFVAAVWFLRVRRMLGHKSSGGVAFENPSYLREVNGVQVLFFGILPVSRIWKIQTVHLIVETLQS